MKSLLVGAALAASFVPAVAHPAPEPHRHDDLIAVNVDPQGGTSREAYCPRLPGLAPAPFLSSAD